MKFRKILAMIQSLETINCRTNNNIVCSSMLRTKVNIFALATNKETYSNIKPAFARCLIKALSTCRAFLIWHCVECLRAGSACKECVAVIDYNSNICTSVAKEDKRTGGGTVIKVGSAAFSWKFIYAKINISRADSQLLMSLLIVFLRLFYDKNRFFYCETIICVVMGKRRDVDAASLKRNI